MSAILQLRALGKLFAGVPALSDVGFDVASGSVHGIMGENGAGKSTLMKILSGIERADAGEVLYEGRAVAFTNPREAMAMGICIVHQELNLVPSMTVAENLFLGSEPRWAGLLLDRRALNAEATALLTGLGIALDPATRVDALSSALRQLVEIAKALARNPRVLILDEPTSSLSNAETEILYGLVARLKRAGVTILYISHRMREIFTLCDAVTVLRDGRHISTRPIAETSHDEVVRQMVGRELLQAQKVHRSHADAATVLEVEGLSRPGRYQDISFSVRRGEIVGIAGLIGAGRSDVADGIFAAEPPHAGQIRLDGRPLNARRPAEAMAAGIALVPEDRKLQGLVLDHSVAENMTLAVLRRLAFGPFRRRGAERGVVERYCRRLSVKARSPDQTVGTLSGGNQQKVLLAKWLATQPKLLIVDEPTRGVDVGTKAEVYALMEELAGDGLAILIISSDMPELLAVSDRILVMREGRLVGEIAGRDATEHQIMKMAAQVG